MAGSGDFFNILSYASRSVGFASSSASALGLTESYMPASLLLIAGSNAFPSLAFTVAGGNTQTVLVAHRRDGVHERDLEISGYWGEQSAISVLSRGAVAVAS
ncbi:MAG: hypothetical protein MUF81_05685 [Verrucomicrobia bacterium]|nr:hypothetical protein [Verrucomicrobiota bacterium]